MKRNPIPSVAGPGPKQYSKTRTGYWSQHLSSCTASPELGGRWRRDASVRQLRSGCPYYFGPCARAKLTTYAHGVATEPMCRPGAQDGKEAQCRNLRNEKPAPKPTHLQPNATWPRVQATPISPHWRRSIMWIFSLLPMVTPPPAPWEEKCWSHVVNKPSVWKRDTYMPCGEICLVHLKQCENIFWQIIHLPHRYCEFRKDAVFCHQRTSALRESPQLLETFPPSTEIWKQCFSTCSSHFAPESKQPEITLWHRGAGVLTGKSTSYSTFPRDTSAAQHVIYWLTNC